MFCCFRYRIQINDKITEIVFLTLTFTISPPWLLATTTHAGFARNYCVFYQKLCNLRNGIGSVNPCIGLIKDELGGEKITKFAAMRPKPYNYLTDNTKEKGHAKVCNKAKI